VKVKSEPLYSINYGGTFLENKTLRCGCAGFIAAHMQMKKKLLENAQ
jgi:ribosomal protein S27AE